MHWTVEKLRALSLKQRDNLFDNARAQDTDEARAIIDMLVENDLLARAGGGLTREHPIIQRMEEVIRSSIARHAAINASDNGLPALAGIDAMLAEALGANYGEHDTTSWAGTLTAEVMEEAGYVQTRKKAMPLDCVAKTAAFFQKRR